MVFCTLQRMVNYHIRRPVHFRMAKDDYRGILATNDRPGGERSQSFAGKRCNQACLAHSGHTGDGFVGLNT